MQTKHSFEFWVSSGGGRNRFYENPCARLLLQNSMHMTKVIHYNSQIKNALSQNADPLMADFLEAMTDAAKANLTPISMTQKNRYLSHSYVELN